jgi:hypothetical protein
MDHGGPSGANVHAALAVASRHAARVHGRSLLELFMSITRNHNGSITLTNLAELGEVLDLQSLRPAPDVSADEKPIQESDDIIANDEHAQEADATSSDSSTTEPMDLATLIAHMATVSSGLESMARQDARAREQATVELAQYENLRAECQDAQRALAEASRLRALAERLAAEAFTDEGHAQAAQHAALARSTELTCTQLLAERTRTAEELASHPYLARALADRRRIEQEQADAARRTETDRTARLAAALAALSDALTADKLDEAQRQLEWLAREFPDHDDVRSKADVIRWRLRQRLVAPAEAALRDVVRRPYRDDPEATAAHLAELHIDGLPEDLARRVFGLWSNACARVVQQRGWHAPRRYAPATSRGVIFARPTPGEPFQVVSVLGLTDWRPGELVTAQHVVQAARQLETH